MKAGRAKMASFQFYFRVALVALGGAAISVFVLLAAPWTNRANLNYLFCSWGSWFGRKVLRWKLVTIDRSIVFAEGPAVIIGNHQSGLDFFVTGLFCPPGCVPVVKRELRFVPFLGFYLMASKAIFLHRARRESSIKALARVAQVIRATGLKVGIFPEGTRNLSKTVPLLPLKKGAFVLAIEAQVPIRVVVCSRMTSVYSWNERRWSPGTLVIQALPEISTKGLSLADVEALRSRVEARMSETILKISNPEFRPHPGLHQVEIFE